MSNMNYTHIDQYIRYANRAGLFEPKICRALDETLERGDTWWGWLLDAVEHWLETDNSLTIEQAVKKALQYG